MKCQKCKKGRGVVIDSRAVDAGQIRRRYQCKTCGAKWTTRECAIIGQTGAAEEAPRKIPGKKLKAENQRLRGLLENAKTYIHELEGKKEQVQKNGKAEPVHIRWTHDEGGTFPECPSCREMPYSLERCVFCGQRFLADVLTEEWSKPPEEVRMDCFRCGGKGTMIGARARCNGHFRGECTACGCRVIE